MNTYRLKSKTFVVTREAGPGYRCSSPREAGPVLRAVFAGLDLDEGQEHFVVLCLDVKGGVVGYKVVSSGSETGTIVTPSMVFRAALVLGGTSVLCCHNHPSGDPTPSREDEMLTKRLRSAGETLGLPLADHVILGASSIHSFRAHEGWDHSSCVFTNN